jgi:two-component system sensor histidine kinase BaeS
MKVSTKVAAGAGLLVSLLLVALARDMALVRDLADVHRTLSEERFTAVTSTLEILRSLELSEERIQKLFVTRDAAYAAQLDRLGSELDAQLSRQQTLTLPSDERGAVTALSAKWTTYRDTIQAHRAALTAPKAPGQETLRTELVAKAGEVRGNAVSLLSALRAGIDRDVERSQQEVLRGERISWIISGIAVVCAVLFVLVTIRSLNTPLARLIAATRSVATERVAKLAPRGSDELSELARAFDAMVERLDELDQVKRDFLSRISHELKTPLSAMQETTQLLIDELAGPLTDKQRRMLQLNREAGRRLSAMLSRLLDLSRLEAGAVAYDVQSVDLGGLLSTAYHEFEARLAEKQISATLNLPERPIVIDADRDWLVQVFENLLENAIKFSQPQRRLWLELRLASISDKVSKPPTRAQALLSRQPCAIVTIADEGPGIPEDVTERVFERFFQVERRKRAGSGVGLGLAICRDIVAAHGGAVWAENRVEGGCVFAVALPLPVVEEQQVGSNEADDSPEKTVRAGALPRPGRAAGGV